ncbi:MAG: DUF4150 domain-containing protein [Clostridia bacterium]|nr:DUF4150 domain-containing protein [Clostridia bacterium]
MKKDFFIGSLIISTVVFCGSVCNVFASNIPIPYSTSRIILSSDCSKSVVSCQPYISGSYTSAINGNEAGTAKGVISNIYVSYNTGNMPQY